MLTGMDGLFRLVTANGCYKQLHEKLHSVFMMQKVAIIFGSGSSRVKFSLFLKLIFF